MATQWGTSHFVDRKSAALYYRDYADDRNMMKAYALVQRKLKAGEIHLGKPQVKAGEKLILIDGGKRYAIESQS